MKTGTRPILPPQNRAEEWMLFCGIFGGAVVGFLAMGVVLWLGVFAPLFDITH